MNYKIIIMNKEIFTNDYLEANIWFDFLKINFCDLQIILFDDENKILRAHNNDSAT